MPSSNPKKLDIVIPLSKNDLSVAEKTINSLLTHISPERIYLITTQKTHKKIIRKIKRAEAIIFLDEETLIPGVSPNSLNTHIKKRKTLDKHKNRGGWYYQQFAKMYFSKLSVAKTHYLIWDADTILFHKIIFFSEDGKILLDRSKMFDNPAYFTHLKKYWGLDRIDSESFIKEQMPINSQHMREIISGISDSKDPAEWIWNVMHSIKDKDISYGFSEFELYGTYCTSKHPNEYSTRRLRSTRHGASKFGIKPNRFDLLYLAKRYDYASFEKWNKGRKRGILKWKTLSFIDFLKDSLLRIIFPTRKK